MQGEREGLTGMLKEVKVLRTVSRPRTKVPFKEIVPKI